MLRLIGWGARLIGVSPIIVALGGILLGSAALYGIWWGFTSHYIGIGEARADARWQAAVAKEQQRQQQAQEEARRAAEAEIARLRDKEEELNAELAILQAEALADPGAVSCGLGADGVRRIDKIR
jgi:hypothetical protein